jgi:diacylglycerol kinase
MNRSRHNLWRSLGCALRGIYEVFRLERNIKIQVAIAILAVIAGVLLELTSGEWCILVITIAAVLTAELFNSAIERAIDLATQEHHELARHAKDAAAGAVLLLSVAAVIVGLIVYGQAAMRMLP